MTSDSPQQNQLDFGADYVVHGAAGLGGLKTWAPQQWPVSADWQVLVDQFLASSAGIQLAQFITSRLEQGAVIFPAKPFWALELTPLAQVSVFILGQDPYHGVGQAQGLAFSVPPQVKTPPSLRNIIKEIERDPLVGPAISSSKGEASLVSWAQQGVLLLNTVLTVEEAQPASHANQGWKVLTDEIVRAVAKKEGPVVFMLWGKHAQSKIELIKSVQAGLASKGSRQLILTANHPSPLSAARKPHPFMGCGHFSLANAFLIKNGGQAIDWSMALRK